MKPGEALMELTRIGFRFRLEGEAVKVKFEGDHLPDKAAVSHLLDLVRADKAEVREFLRCYCPKCGGVVYLQGECFDCLEGHTIRKENLGMCSCGAPAWDIDADGKEKCWCCLAIPGLFGKH